MWNLKSLLKTIDPYKQGTNNVKALKIKFYWDMAMFLSPLKVEVRPLGFTVYLSM